MIQTMQLARAGLVLAFAGAAGLAIAQSPPPHVPGRILVQFKPTATAEQVRYAVRSINGRDKGEIPRTGIRIISLPSHGNEVSLGRSLQGKPGVKSVDVDYIRFPQQASTLPNDVLYSMYQGNLRQICCPAAWPASTGRGVVIAILDSGIEATHPDLASKLVPGWDVYNNIADTSDALGHGTRVAGFAAAATNNSAGLAGVAWDSKLMPVKIAMPDGSTTDSLIAAGITWAADHGARIANVSYQASNIPAVDSAAQYMLSKGGVVTISAGNAGYVDTRPDDPYVLTVTSLNSNDTIVSYANRGNNLDLGAPDGGWTTELNGTYNVWGGTSMAAPLVAGVAALVISANPALTGNQVQDILKKSARDLGTSGWDPTFGWGCVNASSAVALALGGGTGGSTDSSAPTVAITSPASGASAAGTVTVQASASDNVGVASVSFYIDSASSPFATSNAAPYSVAWNSVGLVNGTHTLKAIARDAAGNSASTSIPVVVINNTAPTVAAPASASSNAVSGKSVSLSVLGADDGGEPALTYSWTSAGQAPVTFSANSTNAAKNTTATFAMAGSYTFTVTIKDAQGLSVTSSVAVNVGQTPTALAVSPSVGTVAAGNSLQFAATAVDQFGATCSPQPAISWSASGGGAISGSGLFTAGSVAGGPHTITAAAGVVGTAKVTVSASDSIAPTVTITSPTGGTAGTTVSVSAAASDNVGVTKVELWVDGKLFATDTGQPWSFSVGTKSWKRGSTHTLLCKAYDAAGNVGVSAPVSIKK